ncbi:MAG: Nucleoside diphosphate pyrophosphatase [Rhodospirillales bacterium]|nr:Nucleoside diphosphate pyrophosphatase [Rhodospirillales bacterium]
MDRNDVEILAKETVYDGYFRIDRYTLRHRRHEAGWTPQITREVFERGHVAAVLPYDPDRDAVVLIEQFRIGAYAAGKPCWLTEIVAGVIDAGEAAEAVARREMEEETGCPVGALEPIGSYLSSPGGASESVALYVGRVDSRNAAGVHGLADEAEDIKVLVRPWSEVEAELKAGLFTNAATLIALQWLALNRAELRRRWR